MKKTNLLFCTLVLCLHVYANPVPYLQTPGHNSIWVNWRTASATESKVLYGESVETLNNTAEGIAELFSSTEDNNYSYTYHSVQLNDLKPSTRYFYKVVSGNLESDIYSFKTQPLPGTGGIYRFIILGDHQRFDDRYERLMKAAKTVAESKYGTPIEEHINLVTNVGDQVDRGTLKQYDQVHFMRSQTLSPNLPIMTMVGNHETYGDNNPLRHYNNHYIYDKIEYKGVKSNSEYYYAMQQGRALFLILSTEHTGTTQYNWAKEVIEKAKADDEIDWIFSYNHRPIQAEQYVGDVSTWVRDKIIPLLNTTEKSVLNVAGHHHLYHRGQLRDYPTYHIITGGAAWDQRWGQSTEKDFDDVQKTIDYWPFQIVELNSDTQTMSVETYIIGNEVETLAETKLVDSFFRTFGKAKPGKPVISPLQSTGIELPYTFESSAYSNQSGYEYNSVQFQVARDNTFSELEFDRIRDYENIFGAHPAGAQLVDINKAVDIFKQTFTKNDLYNGEHFIRVRHRDRNLEWSDWSDPIPFTSSGGIEGAPVLKISKNNHLPNETIEFFFEYLPNMSDQWIGIYKQSQQPKEGNVSVKWKYVTGESGTESFTLTEPGVYFAAIFRDGGYDLLAQTDLFYVGSIPVLQSEKSKYKPEEKIKITYSNAPNISKDWIGLYKESHTPENDKATLWVYVSATSGEHTFSGLPEGDYYINYFMQDKYYEPGERVYVQVTNDTANPYYKSSGMAIIVHQDNTNNILNIFYASDKKETGLIYNINGTVLKTFSFENSASLSTASLNSGFYLVSVDNKVEKVIIQ